VKLQSLLCAQYYSLLFSCLLFVVSILLLNTVNSEETQYILFVGIQFSYGRSKEIQSFTYATLPGIPNIPLDWKICCKKASEIYGENVVFYKLANAEESLADVISKKCSDDVDSMTVGFIIANITPDTALPSEVLKKGIPENPPVYIVSSNDGEQIESLLSQYGIRLQVKVLGESNEDLGYPRPFETEERGEGL